jgi:hypothetical protein
LPKPLVAVTTAACNLRRCLRLDAPAAQLLGEHFSPAPQVLLARIEPPAVASLGTHGQMDARVAWCVCNTIT